ELLVGRRNSIKDILFVSIRVHSWPNPADCTFCRLPSSIWLEALGMFAKTCFLAGLAAVAWGQTSNKVVYFAHLDSPQAITEVFNAVRSIGDIRDASVDLEKRSISVSGTANQVAFADWFTAELDRTGRSTGTKDFAFNDSRLPVAQVFYLNHVDDPRHLQEIVNAVRSMADIQRCLPVNQQMAIAMRGSA